ncbi:hypothetical protein C7H84_35325, partial [Burkholderia sp. Nafp2/4-1b]|uniref:ESPR-type extended signal peptide-containing protein n=1 Tax=Burkholderia sp. Nafp2/4-1b TaxID=2116686 RepID=UPI000F10AFA6
MNRAYRSVWNETTRTWNAVQETAKGKTKGSTRRSTGVARASVAAAVLAVTLGAWAPAALADGEPVPAEGSVGELNASGDALSPFSGNANAAFNLALADDDETRKRARHAQFLMASNTPVSMPGVLHSPLAAADPQPDPTSENMTQAQKDAAMAANKPLFVQGKGAVAWGRAVAIGESANAMYGQKASVTDTDSVAIGRSAEAAYDGLAIGESAKARGTRSIALGRGSMVEAEDGFAIGYDTRALDKQSIALGTGSVAQNETIRSAQERVLSLGKKDNSLKTRILHVADAMDNTDAASYGQVKRVESLANANTKTLDTLTNSDGFKVGKDAKARGRAIAIGKGANAMIDKDKWAAAERTLADAAIDSQDSVAIGTTAQATYNATAVGWNARAYGQNSTAMGVGSQAAGESSIALGKDAVAVDQYTMALGMESVATGGTANERVLSLGHKKDDISNVEVHGRAPSKHGSDVKTRITNVANGRHETDAATYGQVKKVQDRLDDNKVHFGKDAAIVAPLAGTTGSVAMGQYAKAYGQQSIAIGDHAQVGKNEAKNNAISGIALGTDAMVQKSKGIAIGSGAEAIGEGSIAIGRGSVATEAETVSFGYQKGEGSIRGAAGETHTRELVNVRAGTKDHSVATVKQLKDVASQIADDFKPDASGEFNDPTFTAQGANFTSLSGALGAVDKAVTTNASGIKGLKSAANTLAQQVESLTKGENVQFGKDSNAARKSIALGAMAQATDVNAIAIGENSRAYNKGNVAVGSDAFAMYTESAAIGARASTAAGNAVALGADSIATEADTVSVGHAADAKTSAIDGRPSVTYKEQSTRRIVNVKDGVHKTDVVTKNQLDNVETAAQNALKEKGEAIANLKQEVDDKVSTTAMNTAISEATKASTEKLTKVVSGEAGPVQVTGTDTKTVQLGKTLAGTTLDVTGADGVRTIVGVKAGLKDGEAVNLEQVKATFGSDIQVDGSGAVQVKLKNNAYGTVTDRLAEIEALAAQTPGLAMSHAITVTPIATGADSIAIGDGSIADGDGVVSVGSTAKKRRITNVEAGTESADVVTKGQMDARFHSAYSAHEQQLSQKLSSVQEEIKKLASEGSKNKQGLDGAVGDADGDNDIKLIAVSDDADESAEVLESDNSLAIGPKAKVVKGSHSVAIGAGAHAAKGMSTAIGGESYANGENAMAVGKGAEVVGDSSVALGAGAKIGTPAYTNVNGIDV